MERCSIYDNITYNTTGSMEPWQEPELDLNNWDLPFEIKILALLLYLFLFMCIEIHFSKQLCWDFQNATQDEETEIEGDDHVAVEDSSTNTEVSSEEKTTETEAKVVTVDAATTAAAPVKRKTIAAQRKKEAPKRHLVTTDLTNSEPVAKKKYQELQIIIDFHDIRELKQNPEMSLPGADIRTWPSIKEIKQQRLQPLKNKHIPKEECESLCSYIHYTNHVLLQRVHNYLQELLQLVGNGCRIIETEHQIIVKVLMVKDAIGLWEKKQLNEGSKDTVCPKTGQKEQSLRLVKNRKKENEMKQNEMKPTKLPKEMSFLGQHVEKQDHSGSFKEKRKEVERQFKDARRKVLVRSPKSPTQKDVQKIETMLPTKDAENHGECCVKKDKNGKDEARSGKDQAKLKKHLDAENLVKCIVECECDGKEEARSGREEARSGKDEARSGRDEAKPKKHSSKSKKNSAKSRKELAKSPKDLAKSIATPQNEVCTRDVATWCHDDDDEPNITIQGGKIITQQNFTSNCKNVEAIIQYDTETLCKSTKECGGIYFGKNPKEQALSSCCCEYLCEEGCAENDVVYLCENTEDPVLVCSSEILEDQCTVCSCQTCGGEGQSCACQTCGGEGQTCACETNGSQCTCGLGKKPEQECMACSCESKGECVACQGEKSEEFTIFSDKSSEEESIFCTCKDAGEEGVTCRLCENSQETGTVCRCRNHKEVLSCCCEKRDGCVDCCCKITEEHDMVCTYYNHGLKRRFCSCCKSREQSKVCSCDDPDV